MDRSPQPQQPSEEGSGLEEDRVGENMGPQSPSEDDGFGSRKRKKNSHRLQSQAEEDETLDWVIEHPILWNPKNKEYLMRMKKDRICHGRKRRNFSAIQDSISFGWFKDLRDCNTKLVKARSESGNRILTEREKWIFRRFQFLVPTIRIRRAPIKSVREAIARASGDLEDAERLAAEDRVTISEVEIEPPVSIAASNVDTPASTSNSARTGQTRLRDDSNIESIRKTIYDTTAQIQSMKNALPAIETPSVRNTFVEYVKMELKQATEDEFSEFQHVLNQMFSRWRYARRPRPSGQEKGSSTSQWQPPPSQWKLAPVPSASVWDSQSRDYMNTYLQQPIRNHPSWRHESNQPNQASTCLPAPNIASSSQPVITLSSLIDDVSFLSTPSQETAAFNCSSSPLNTPPSKKTKK